MAKTLRTAIMKKSELGNKYLKNTSLLNIDVNKITKHSGKY